MAERIYDGKCIFCVKCLHHTDGEHSYSVRVEDDRLAAIEKRKIDKKEKTKKDKQSTIDYIRQRDRERYLVPNNSDGEA